MSRDLPEYRHYVGAGMRIATFVGLAALAVVLAGIQRTIPLPAIASLALEDLSVAVAWVVFLGFLGGVCGMFIGTAADNDRTVITAISLLAASLALAPVAIFSAVQSPAARQADRIAQVTLSRRDAPARVVAIPSGLQARIRIADAARRRIPGAVVDAPAWIPRTRSWCAQLQRHHVVVAVACRRERRPVRMVMLPDSMRHRVTLGSARWWHSDDPQLLLARRHGDLLISRDPGYGYLHHGTPMLVRYVLAHRGGLVTAPGPAGVLVLQPHATVYLAHPDADQVWGPTVSSVDARTVVADLLARRAEYSPSNPATKPGATRAQKRAAPRHRLAVPAALGSATLVQHSDGSLGWQLPIAATARIAEVAATSTRHQPYRVSFTRLNTPLPSPAAALDVVERAVHAPVAVRAVELAPDHSWRLHVTIRGRDRVETVDPALQRCTTATVGCADVQLVSVERLARATPEQLATLQGALQRELDRRAP